MSILGVLELFFWKCSHGLRGKSKTILWVLFGIFDVVKSYAFNSWFKLVDNLFSFVKLKLLLLSERFWESWYIENTVILLWFKKHGTRSRCCSEKITKAKIAANFHIWFLFVGGVGGGEGQGMHLRYKLSTLLSLNFLQWYAIGLSIVGDYEGNKAKLENSKIMKDHFEVRHMITIGKPVHKNHVVWVTRCLHLQNSFKSNYPSK